MPRKKEPAEFTDHQQTVLCVIGAGVLMCHRIEFLLARCFLFILAENPDGVDGSNLPNLLSERNSKTLGNLITRLRKHFHIAKSFDRTLERFLRNRNLLIHGISGRPDYDLYTKRGAMKLHRLGSRLVLGARSVEEVLIGCYSASLNFLNWQHQEEGRQPPYRNLEPEYEKHFFKLFQMKDNAPNHALQRTAPRVTTACATCLLIKSLARPHLDPGFSQLLIQRTRSDYGRGGFNDRLQLR